MPISSLLATNQSVYFSSMLIIVSHWIPSDSSRKSTYGWIQQRFFMNGILLNRWIASFC